MHKASWPAVDVLIREAFGGATSSCNKLAELYVYLQTCILSPRDVAAVPLPAGVEEADLTEDDITKLLCYDYIIEIGSVDNVQIQIHTTVRVFTVTQGGTGQALRRVIFCPDGINGVLIDAGFQTSPEAHIPTVDEQKADMFDFPGALTGDGTAFYTQFPSSGGTGDFIFSWKGRLFQCSSICTGQRQCVCLAQIVLLALREVTLRHFGPNPSVRITPFIDNVRFAGARYIAERAWTIFRERAARCGLTFEVVTEWSPRYVFLGIQYDHETKVCSIGPKSLQKLANFDTLLSTDVSQWTMSNFLSLFGLLIWANSVLELCPAAWYTVFKFIRRRGDRALEQPADVWPCTYQQLHHWIHTIQSSTVPLRQAQSIPRENIFIFSDACPTGFGVLIFAGSFIFVTAGPFHREENIFVLEARAFLYGLQFLLTLQAEHKVAASVFCHFRVDNTSTIGATKKGRSNNFHLNLIVVRLHTLLLHIQWDLTYVRSEDNSSDALSRLLLARSMSAGFDEHGHTVVTEDSLFMPRW